MVWTLVNKNLCNRLLILLFITYLYNKSIFCDTTRLVAENDVTRCRRWMWEIWHQSGANVIELLQWMRWSSESVTVCSAAALISWPNVPLSEHCLNIKVQICQIFCFRRSYIYQGPSASHCTRCFSPSFEFINNNLGFFLHVIYWNSHTICKIQIRYCY